MEDSTEFDPDQGERILKQYITEELAKKYFAMFWGRTDVYAKRGKNGGYYPQCDNRWIDRMLYVTKARVGVEFWNEKQ